MEVTIKHKIAISAIVIGAIAIVSGIAVKIGLIAAAGGIGYKIFKSKQS